MSEDAAYASVQIDVAMTGIEYNERLGVVIDITPEILAKYRDDPLPWKHRADVRIIYGEQVLEMTFAEFLDKVGIKP